MHRQPRHNRIPLGLLAVAVVALCVPVVLLLVFGWQAWLTFSAAQPAVAWLLQLVLFGSLASAPVVLLALAWRRYADHRYIQAHHVERLTLAQRSQGLPDDLTSLNIHPMPPSQLTAAPDALQLPAPITLSQEAEWLTWTDQAPHLMVAGRTDSGKTTTVEAVLARRIIAGDMVLVIDPHYQSGKWLGAVAVGGGRDYAACYQTFDLIRDLLNLRYQAFNAGTKTEDFKRVTVVVDEVPAIIAHAQAAGKAMYERWLLFANQLGSEARKVRISIILSTQSALVRDIGISSAMRDNFARLALGDVATDLLREEPNAEKKQALIELLRGRPYPAAMEYRNNWYALRNDSIRDLARTNGRLPRVPSLLLPASPVSAPPVQPQSTPAAAPLAPTVRVPVQPVPPTTALSLTNADQVLLTLDGAQRHLTASEIATRLRWDIQLARTVVDQMFDAGMLSRQRVQDKRTRETWEYTRLNNKTRPSGPLVASA